MCRHHRAARSQQEARARLHRQVFNQHNPAKAADFVTADVVWHGGGLGDIAGPDNLAGLLESFIGALPDLYAAEQDIIAENDLVVVRLVITRHRQGKPAGGAGRRQAGPVERRGHLPGYQRQDQRGVGRRTTSRRSWPRSAPSARRGQPDVPSRQQRDGRSPGRDPLVATPHRPIAPKPHCRRARSGRGSGGRRITHLAERGREAPTPSHDVIIGAGNNAQPTREVIARGHTEAASGR